MIPFTDLNWKQYSLQFSNTLLLDALCHAGIGFTIGIIIIWVRGNAPMPTLLLNAKFAASLEFVTS